MGVGNPLRYNGVVDKGEKLLPWKPFTGWPEPLAGAALAGVGGEFVNALAPHTEADPAGLLVQFLVAYGSVAGRNGYFLVESDRHHPNLFAVMVGASSKGRKGTSWGRIKEPFGLIDPEWRVMTGLASGEGVIATVRDRQKRVQAVGEDGRASDADKRLCVVEAEFSSRLRVMGREGNSLSGILREAWDTGDLHVMTRNDPLDATGAHISIIGHTTKEELNRYLQTTEAGNGFANRFLWTCVGRSKYLPEGGSFDLTAIAPICERLKESVAFGQSARRVTRSDQAAALWREVYKSLSDGRTGLLGAVTSRAEAQVTRLSLIYALLDRSPVIGLNHLEAALEVWRYCEQSAAFIFGESLGDPVADTILANLRNSPQGVTRTEISGLFNGHAKAGQITVALSSLVGNRLARFVVEETPGRSVERWFIN